MSEFFAKLFDTSDFPPRWYCGNWTDIHGWLHIVSDLAIWSAYFAIPLVLIFFARKRKDFPFTGLFWLFAAFIVACGTVHLVEAIIFWYPVYRVSGMAKFATATVSWITVFALIPTIPKVLHFPSLATTNQQLKLEMAQREVAQAELRQIMARHDALLAGTHSIVWTTNADGRFDTPQSSWERYTGQTWDEHRDFGWVSAIHEDDRKELLKKWEQARSQLTKYESSGRIWHSATQMYRAFASEAVPVYHQDGTVREWVGTVRDIEDEHQATRSLRAAQVELARQKRELELIYETAPVGMCLVDRQYRYIRVNEALAKMNGYPEHEHVGRSAHEILGALSDQIEPMYEQVFSDGGPIVEVEVVGTTAASPSDRTWLYSCHPLVIERAESGKPAPVVAVSSVVQDITDRKLYELRLRKSEQEALAANQSKSAFLANMSHEIRTPMAAILGYADVLLGRLNNPEDRDIVVTIKRNGDFLLELINDILDLSKIEAGKLDFELEACDLPALVADVHSLMRVRAEEKKLAIDAAFSGEVPRTFQTDQTRLRQVLINLIGNAIKFTDKGGEVRLRVRMVPGDREVGDAQIEFAIEDTGIGISEDHQKELFQPFSQGDTSVTRSYGGSGLGLAISKRLITMLGGTIDLKSQPGNGSTFYVRLPVGQVDQADLVEPELGETAPKTEAQRQEVRLECRVLVVDDRRDVRFISQHFLEEAGAQVVTAEDGQQGFDMAVAARDDGDPFDLILMDMHMPNVDGLQATAELRAAGIEWPIIALTADAMIGDRERYLDGGCDDYLSKPIDHAALVEMVCKYTQQVDLEALRSIRKARAEKRTPDHDANHHGSA